MRLRFIVTQEKKWIYANKNVHPPRTLATTFLKTLVEENPYIIFVYGPHTICNNAWGQVSGSMNVDSINMNKKFNNKHR